MPAPVSENRSLHMRLEGWSFSVFFPVLLSYLICAGFKGEVSVAEAGRTEFTHIVHLLLLPY